MSVHQLKDGRWIVQFREEDGGKLKREYFGRGPEAEKAAFKRNDQLCLRPYKRTVQGHSAFFVDLVNSYADSRTGIVQETTLINFMWKMDGVILPELGHIRAMNITPKRADKYVKKRLATETKKKTLIKRTTVHRELSDIKAVLNWSAKRNYIAFNPLRDYEMPKRDDAVILPPSSAEIDAIIKHAPDRLIRAISVSYYTGLRPGQRELYSLKWSDVDFEAGTILVTSAKKGGDFKYRLVPIHSDFVRVLNHWYNQDKRARNSLGTNVPSKKNKVKTDTSECIKQKSKDGTYRGGKREGAEKKL